MVALPDAAAAAALKLKAVARARAADEAAAGKGADGGHSESKKVAPSVETLAELVASLHAVSAGAGGAGGAGGGGGLLDAVAEAKASSGL